jgi:hypothetical protein
VGEKDIESQIAFAGKPGTELPVAMRETFNIPFGVLGAGPTGARSRSQ